jgi:transcriptional regulator with XRE-family HTH domain
MPRPAPPDLGIVLTFLRTGQGWSQSELGDASGVAPTLINDYERGRKPLNRARLERLADALGLPPAAIDETLRLLEENRAAGGAPQDADDPSAPSRRRIGGVAARAARMTSEFSHSLLSLLTMEGEALLARQRADGLWELLKRQPADVRLALVEDSQRFRGWALCERVAAESIAAAPNHPRQALELADLSRRLAERAPGTAAWRRRLQGYAWAHVGNARRVCNDLPGADDAIRHAWKLWEDGAAGDRGFLAAAWLPWIEAGLRKDQRRFPEALTRIDEALALDQGELRAQILMTKARILETLGDPETSTAVLRKAALLIDGRREPRLMMFLRFNLLVDLCRLDRAAEAELGLAEVRELAQRLGEELELVRVVWLEGKVAVGMGRTAEAYAAFQQVRRVFTVRELAYDAALVSLELAVILLEQGRTAEVHVLARGMAWIFRAQGVHLETLAALRLFCEAVEREAATVELARRVVSYLYQAQYDPELQFKHELGAEAR